MPEVIIRTNIGSNNKTSVSRFTGNNIDFSKITYFDYSMRRKAEVLQYNNKTTTTTKSKFSNLVNGPGSYSQATLQKIINSRVQENCPIVIKPSSNSGVYVNNNIGYYLDVNIPFNSGL
jgi:hypothetical protein